MCPWQTSLCFNHAILHIRTDTQTCSSDMPAKVQLPTGEEIEVEMIYCETTIDDIKRKIEEEYPCYPVVLQILSFDDKHWVDGSKTLEEIDYVKDRCLVLNMMPGLKIICSGSEPIILEFKGLEEIADFRRRVAAALSITPERLKLTIDGAIVEDKAGYTVEDNGIVEGSEIHAHVLSGEYINITVRMFPGKLIDMQLAMCQTIGDAKDSLTTMIGLKRNNMRLVLNGRQLEDTKTLTEAGISDGSFLYLETRP